MKMNWAEVVASLKAASLLRSESGKRALADGAPQAAMFDLCEASIYLTLAEALQAGYLQQNLEAEPD